MIDVWYIDRRVYFVDISGYLSKVNDSCSMKTPSHLYGKPIRQFAINRADYGIFMNRIMDKRAYFTYNEW